jgi:hypothetical protein
MLAVLNRMLHAAPFVSTYRIHEDPAVRELAGADPALVPFTQPQTPLGGVTWGLTAGGGAAGVPMGSGATPPMLKPAGDPGPDTCCPAT